VNVAFLLTWLVIVAAIGSAARRGASRFVPGVKLAIASL
jgi:hypothetical protein